MGVSKDSTTRSSKKADSPKAGLSKDPDPVAAPSSQIVSTQQPIELAPAAQGAEHQLTNTEKEKERANIQMVVTEFLRQG